MVFNFLLFSYDGTIFKVYHSVGVLVILLINLIFLAGAFVLTYMDVFFVLAFCAGMFLPFYGARVATYRPLSLVLSVGF